MKNLVAMALFMINSDDERLNTTKPTKSKLDVSSLFLFKEGWERNYEEQILYHVGICHDIGSKMTMPSQEHPQN